MVREAPFLTHDVQQTQCSLVIAVRNFQSPIVLCSCELCSHHRRQPDRTKQFCRVGVGGVKWVLLSLGQYYWDVLLTPELTPAIRSIGDVTVFHQDNAPVHRARDTVQRYQTHNFINPGMWAANGCDVNPIDYSIWGMSSIVCVLCGCSNPHDTHELLQRLVETQAYFQQSVVDDAIDQWRQRLGACIHEESGHCEQLLWRYSCLTFTLPHTAHNTTGSFQSHQRLEGNNNTFHQMNEFCIS